MLGNATDASYTRIRRRRLDRQLARLQVNYGGKSIARFKESASQRLKDIRYGLSLVDGSDDETGQ